MVELKRVLLIWGMALAAWAQPEPLPTPTEPAAPVVVPVAQPRVVSHPRFLVARGETLRFPSSATTAPPPNDYCRFEKKAGGWFVTGVAPGVASFNWGKDHWDILVRERALLLPSSLPLTVFGDYPVGQALRYKPSDANAQPQSESLVTIDGHARPIDLGPDWGNNSDQVFLVLYGTGFRFRSSLANMTARIGGETAPVHFVGAQGDFAGLDQINIQIPRSLIGRGEVNLVMTVDGQQANVVKVYIK